MLRTAVTGALRQNVAVFWDGEHWMLLSLEAAMWHEAAAGICVALLENRPLVMGHPHIFSAEVLQEWEDRTVSSFSDGTCDKT